MARLPPKKAVVQQIYCKHRQVGASLVWDLALLGKAWNLALVSVAIVMQKSMAFLLCQTEKTGSIITPNKEAPFTLRNNYQIKYSLEAAAEQQPFSLAIT